MTNSMTILKPVTRVKRALQNLSWMAVALATLFVTTLTTTAHAQPVLMTMQQVGIPVSLETAFRTRIGAGGDVLIMKTGRFSINSLVPNDDPYCDTREVTLAEGTTATRGILSDMGLRLTRLPAVVNWDFSVAGAPNISLYHCEDVVLTHFGVGATPATFTGAAGTSAAGVVVRLSTDMHPMVVDWVLIELRTSLGDASQAQATGTVIARKPGLLTNVGVVYDGVQLQDWLLAMADYRPFGSTFENPNPYGTQVFRQLPTWREGFISWYSGCVGESLAFIRARPEYRGTNVCPFLQFEGMNVAGGVNIYPIIRHRNHLSLMGTVAGRGSVTAELDEVQSRALGGGLATVVVGPLPDEDPSYAAPMGDVNGDSQIQVADAVVIKNGTETGRSIYSVQDVNMDSQIQVIDATTFIENAGNTGRGSFVQRTGR